VGVDVESGRKVLKGKDLVDNRVIAEKPQLIIPRLTQGFPAI
jgi:hypothetical protein